VAYVGQQRHGEKKKLVNLSVKGQISPSYTPTSKVIVIFMPAFSGGRRGPTGRVAKEDDDRGSLRFYCQSY